MITFNMPWPDESDDLRSIHEVQDWLAERLGLDQTPATWMMRLDEDHNVIIDVGGEPELASLFRLRFGL